MMIPPFRRVSILLGALALCSPCAIAQTEAALVLTNGNIVTLDEDQPECSAIAMGGGRILALGSAAELAAYIGAGTKVIDVGGRLVTPGFIEGHGHFLGIGDARMQLDLMSVTNWDMVIEMVRRAAEEAADGELIRGRGWHQEKWDKLPVPNVSGLPVHDALSAVSPNNPVVLVHASGHASYANAKAMEMAGINRETKNPDGGEIVRDEHGDPIGVFRERAAGLLAAAYARAKRPDMRRMAELASLECLGKGVTSFQDAGTNLQTVDVLREMAEDGSLSVRLWMMLRIPIGVMEKHLADYRLTNIGDHRLTVGGIKRSIDGALGSHGAWLLEPYTDLASSSGLNTVEVSEVERAAELALEHGFQLCVHAIGDRANREVLDIYERAFAKLEDSKNLRWRIEHAQHLHPDDIPRFGQLGVIASMQGVHCTSDAPWVPDRLGAKRSQEGAYVWQKLMQSGAIVTNGTDAPVEDVDPLKSFYAVVSRRLPDGSVFYPDQRLSRLEALRSYTIHCAYSAFEEDIKGTLTVGKLADVVVFSKNIMTCPEEEILSAKVDMTIIGGVLAYER